MRKFLFLILVVMVAALIVPVGYALSIDSKPKAARTRYTGVVPAAAVVAAPVMMPRVGDAVPGSVMHTLSDSAKLLCIGTVLFGLAAAVRKVN